MRLLPSSVERLINEFAKLPGIGPRTAERLTFYVLRSGQDRAQELGEALLGLQLGVKVCQTCFNLSESDQCAICSSHDRQAEILAVVEDPLDVVAIEKTGLYKGLYHVLGGVISPIDGIGPEQLQIESLLARLTKLPAEEIILAVNATTESETTAMYIRKRLEPLNLKITRLARGLPVGGDLEYADQITLGRALQGRQAF